MLKVKNLGNIYNPNPEGGSFAGMVYDPNGLCPTINICGGGNREPLILEQKLEPRVVGGFGEKKSNSGTQWYQQDRVYSSETVAMCHPSTIPDGSYKYLVGEEKYRVRKLTPKECFLLMGFDASDHKKAEKVCSNSQLYKQAGNSIVVNVLEEIFKQML